MKIEKYTKAKGCCFEFCKNYPKIVRNEVVVNEICNQCIHFKKFNLLEKEEDGNTKNNQNKNKK